MNYFFILLMTNEILITIIIQINYIQSSVRLIPIWGIRNKKGSLIMTDGMPANFISGYIATVWFEFYNCWFNKTVINEFKPCRAFYIPALCHFKLNQYNDLVNQPFDNKKTLCPVELIESKLIHTPWTIQASLIEKNRIIKTKGVYLNQTTVYQFLINLINYAMDKIYKCNTLYSFKFMDLCDWYYYLAIMNFNLNQKFYGSIKSDENKSSKYIFLIILFCKK